MRRAYFWYYFNIVRIFACVYLRRKAAALTYPLFTVRAFYEVTAQFRAFFPGFLAHIAPYIRVNQGSQAFTRAIRTNWRNRHYTHYVPVCCNSPAVNHVQANALQDRAQSLGILRVIRKAFVILVYLNSNRGANILDPVFSRECLLFCFSNAAKSLKLNHQGKGLAERKGTSKRPYCYRAQLVTFRFIFPLEPFFLFFPLLHPCKIRRCIITGLHVAKNKGFFCCLIQGV